MSLRSIPMTLIKNDAGEIKEHLWSFPLEEAFLEAFFRDLFETHYDKLTFGPIIQGAAYELKAPGAPEKITMMDGYFTVHWGGRGHFHLCIGENKGSPKNPNAPELIAHRRPGRAELFRSLDRHGHPISWGFRMVNGHEEPQISIFFPNPFLNADDQLSDEPNWDRLDFWDYILKQYAGHEPDGLDKAGKGFRHG